MEGGKLKSIKLKEGRRRKGEREEGGEHMHSDLPFQPPQCVIYLILEVDDSNMLVLQMQHPRLRNVKQLSGIIERGSSNAGI